MDQETMFERLFLRVLYSRHCIGGKHTEMKNVLRRLKDYPKAEQKTGMKVFKRLVNEGYILIKPSTGEKHVSLNPRMITEIKKKIL